MARRMSDVPRSQSPVKVMRKNASLLPSRGLRAMARSAALRQPARSFRKKSATARACWATWLAGARSTARRAASRARSREPGRGLNPWACSCEYTHDSIAQQSALAGASVTARSSTARASACSSGLSRKWYPKPRMSAS